MAHEKRIGLALGGGGARGIAHILVCEAFDELGLKPAIIAGTSIGAVVGAGYAAGMTGREMRERCCAFYARRRAVYSALWRVRPRALADLVRGRIASAQFDAELILQTFVPGWELLPETFEDLTIPLKVVACDFYGWTETVMETGTLRPAVAASIAIPSIFRPVAIHGRMQIDGGAVNPLPFDLVSDADLVVASDVAGGPSGDPARCPGMLETVIGAAQISMQAVIAAKLKLRHPDILVQPEINGVFVLDFLKSEAILANNVTLKDEVKRRLERAVEAPNDDEEGGPPSPNGTAHHFVISTGAMA